MKKKEYIRIYEKMRDEITGGAYTFGERLPSKRILAEMVLPDALLERFKSCAGFYSCTVSVLEQYIVAELLGSGDFERHINRERRKMRQKNREKI